MTLDDAILRARDGDLDACEAVVRETGALVRAYLALFVRDLHEVNDLAQETYLYAFEHLRDFTPGTNFVAFLKAVARTNALRAWRERQRHEAAHRRYVAAVQERLGEAAAGRDESEPVEGLLPRLRECLGRLSGQARELVRLRYDEGRDPRAIAERLGQTVNRVGVTLFRVRRQLALCLERQEPQGLD